MASVEVAALESARQLGYQSLKDLQLKIVAGVINGRDVFGVLPTGYGKSLCYACLPWTYDRILQCTQSIVCVITPLTAIIEEQVSKSLMQAYGHLHF